MLRPVWPTHCWVSPLPRNLSGGLQQSLTTPTTNRWFRIYGRRIMKGKKSFDIFVSGWFASLLHPLFEVSFWSLCKIFENCCFSLSDQVYRLFALLRPLLNSLIWRFREPKPSGKHVLTLSLLLIRVRLEKSFDFVVQVWWQVCWGDSSNPGQVHPGGNVYMCA